MVVEEVAEAQEQMMRSCWAIRPGALGALGGGGGGGVEHDGTDGAFATANSSSAPARHIFSTPLNWQARHQGRGEGRAVEAASLIHCVTKALSGIQESVLSAL